MRNLEKIQNYSSIYITVTGGMSTMREESPLFDAAKKLSAFTTKEEDEKNFKLAKLALDLKC